MTAARRVGALVAGVLAVGTVAFASADDAGAAVEPCKLVTQRELERAFGTRFEKMASDSTACVWGSKVGRPRASIGVGAERLPAASIAAGKASQTEEPGATTIPGVADLTVYQTGPGEGGSTTINLLVFDGRVVGRVSGSVEGKAPSTASMRKVARLLAGRM